MVTWSLTKEPKTFNGIRTASSTNGAGSTGSQHVEECKPIPLISLYKAQVQVDQGPLHRTIYMETNRKESGEEPRTHGYRTQLLKTMTSWNS